MGVLFLRKILILVSLLIILSSCSRDNKVPTITEPTVAKTIDFKTSKPVEAANQFKPDDPSVYFTIKITNFPKDTTIKAVWKHLDGGTEVQSEITTHGSRYEAFTLKRGSSPFPPGKYEVTASAVVNGSLQEVKGSFNISTDITPSHLLNPTTSKSIDSSDKLNPIDITSEFSKSDTVIYFIVQSKDLPEGTKVYCTWTHIDSNESLSHELTTEGSRNIAFSLKPDGTDGLPPGRYTVSVTVTVNGQDESVSKNFQVK